MINNKTSYTKMFCFYFCILLSFSLFASEPDLDESESSLSYSALIATLSIGPAWEHEGNTQTFYLTDTIQKTYEAVNNTHGFLTGELFLGLQRRLHNALQGQLGIAIATTGNAVLTGNIWDDADPEFNNYTYKYSVTHSHVAIKGELLLDDGYMVIPWISGSAGIGMNKASNFENSPVIVEAISNTNFSSNTNNAFVYTIGAGVKTSLSTHWQLGIGYEFADWGKSQLGRALGQTLGSGLALDHLYTNSILLSLTYRGFSHSNDDWGCIMI